MDPKEVLLIGVFDPDEKAEAFCYTVNAPVNLWIGALCSDGSRMSMDFMQYFLNMLISQDHWNVGDAIDVRNQVGLLLRATVMEDVFARDVEAFQAKTPYVRPVTVEAIVDVEA